MNIQIHECEQRSEEWFRLRLGIPTASEFAVLLATSGWEVMPDGRRRKVDYSTAKPKMARRLASEQLTGIIEESFSNGAMERGRRLEPELRAWYAFQTNLDVRCVGFVSRDCRIGRAGCSPDALVGDDGVLEIKTMRGDLMDEFLDTPRDHFPPEHEAQCMGALWVTGRAWCDLVVGCECAPGFEGMERRVLRLFRDEARCAEIEAAVCRFNHEVNERVRRRRRQ